MLIKRQMRELLTYKQKMTDSTSNDDSDTSKGNYKSTQTDPNEEEKGDYYIHYIMHLLFNLSVTDVSECDVQNKDKEIQVIIEGIIIIILNCVSLGL